MPFKESGEITRIVLLVIVIGTLLLGSFLTLLPFLGGLVWATTITVATWPVMLRLQQLLGGRRSLATLVMTLAAVLAFILHRWTSRTRRSRADFAMRAH